MSNYFTDLECPACGADHMFACDRSEIFGHRNPYVYKCRCGKEWRWTDHGELMLVEYTGDDDVK